MIVKRVKNLYSLMEKFKLAPRRRIFKIWLMAIVCQTAPLFSQPENVYYEPYSLPQQYSLDRPFDGQWPAVSQNEWPVQANPKSQFEPYFETNQPQYSLDAPFNGQWPVSSQNEWKSQTAPQQQFDPYFETSQPQYSLDAPLNGQWPVSSQNEWQNQTEPQQQSYLETSFDNAAERGDSPPSMMHQKEHSQSSHFSSGSAPFPPPEKEDSNKQNFIAFDPDLAEAPDKEQHPLSKSGEAKTFLFEESTSNSSPSSNSQHDEKDPAQKKQNLPKVEIKDAPPEDLAPSLSAGKGNIKIVKKHTENVSSPQRLEEAFQQPETVIGKHIIDDRLLGLDKESEDSEPPSNERNLEDNRHSKEELGDETIAQQIIPPPRAPTVITPNSAVPGAPSTAAPSGSGRSLKEISINFNNVAMIEYIRFISRISNKNFIFDDEDLQFNVTIVSEEPTSVENLMAALLQELKIRDLSLIEQGNNIIIHRNARIRSPARIVSDGTSPISSYESEIVTRVFRLNTLDPMKASEIIRPLLSEDALIEVLRDTNNLIITDLVTNVNKISQLIGTLDAPNSGVTIGQYVVQNAFVDSLVDLATKILQPIAQGNPFVLVPHPVSNSIFIVSNSFIVEKALAILQNLDRNEGYTKILSLENLQLSAPPSGEQPGRRGGGPPGPGQGPGRRGPSEAPGPLFGPGGGAQGGGIPGREGLVPGGPIPGIAVPGGLGRPGGPGGPAGPGGFGGLAPGEAFPGELTPEERGSAFGPGGLVIGGRIPPAGFTPEGFPIQGFGPGGIGTEGRPSAIFDESKDFLPGGIGAASRWFRDLPVGHIERTLFFIYKLRYRKGDNIEIALRKIANSLQMSGTANLDLIAAINSSQWIESSNALIFTGTHLALEKIQELILEIDIPLRQVFIEMLILNTTISDSLSYGVDWVNRFGGGTTTGEQGFLNSQIPSAGDPSLNSFLNNSESIFSGGSVCPPVRACPLPVATGLLNTGGFAAGIIGTHLTHGGTRFSTIGALVEAIHTDSKSNILLNPKIVTQDNNPAEIFVGGTDRYKTQSITNDLGSLVTNNFQFIDVGTTLRVTPLIGNNGIITLEIVQETTNESPSANAPGSGNNQNVNLVQVLTKTRTVTKIHVPDGFFVVLSGMIQESESRTKAQIPCLGGIPIIGVFGKSQATVDDKRNLMLFIRPLIIDSEEDYEDITRRQQDVYREKSKLRRSWNYEIDEGLNFLNIKPTDPDEIGCNER